MALRENLVEDVEDREIPGFNTDRFLGALGIFYLSVEQWMNPEEMDDKALLEAMDKILDRGDLYLLRDTSKDDISEPLCISRLVSLSDIQIIDQKLKQRIRCLESAARRRGDALQSRFRRLLRDSAELRSVVLFKYIDVLTGVIGRLDIKVASILSSLSRSPERLIENVSAIGEGVRRDIGRTNPDLVR